MADKKIVLLIDAENTSAKYADRIIQYLEKQGVIISARLYGDFINNKNVKKWNDKAIQYEMEQKQQLTTTAGKNASDISLVIDAMDLLYLKTIDIFCIVTSDGDFTNLIKRIREDGIEVIGMGKPDASKRLGKVCDRYLDFDQLVDEVGEKTEKKQKEKVNKKEKGTKDDRKIEPLKNIKMALNELVQQDENAGKTADLGGIKSRIQIRYPGFDERDYGYKTIRELIDNETKFEVYQVNRHTYVRSSKKTEASDEEADSKVQDQVIDNEELEQVCLFLLEHFPEKKIELSKLAGFGKQLHKTFPKFYYKNYGYGKLSLFLEELGFEIME